LIWHKIEHFSKVSGQKSEDTSSLLYFGSLFITKSRRTQKKPKPTVARSRQSYLNIFFDYQSYLLYIVPTSNILQLLHRPTRVFWAMQQQIGSRFFIIFLVCSLILFSGLFWAYISSIVMALLISSVFHPLYLRIKALFKGQETWAALFMTIFVLLVLIIPVGWFVGTLSNEAFDFYSATRNSVSIKQIQDFINSDSIWVKRVKGLAQMSGVEFTPDTIESLAASVGKMVGLFLFNQIRSFASNLLSVMLHLFLMMMTIYYLLKDGGRLKEYIVQLLPLPREQLEKVGNKFQEMGRAIIIGSGFSSLLHGIFGGIGFFIFDLNAPFLWGAVIGFLGFIPFIGPSVVYVPAMVMLILEGKKAAAVLFFLYNLSYGTIIEYLVKPRIIGGEMQMNSLLVFIGIIGGIKLFGILGIIYGPLIITVFLTLAEIYRLEYKGQAI
jgi:predicted PurR-regulated permease PerM